MKEFEKDLRAKLDEKLKSHLLKVNADKKVSTDKLKTDSSSRHELEEKLRKTDDELAKLKKAKQNPSGSTTTHDASDVKKAIEVVKEKIRKANAESVKMTPTSNSNDDAPVRQGGKCSSKTTKKTNPKKLENLVNTLVKTASKKAGKSSFKINQLMDSSITSHKQDLHLDDKQVDKLEDGLHDVASQAHGSKEEGLSISHDKAYKEAVAHLNKIVSNIDHIETGLERTLDKSKHAHKNLKL